MKAWREKKKSTTAGGDRRSYKPSEGRHRARSAITYSKELSRDKGRRRDLTPIQHPLVQADDNTRRN